MEFKEMKNVGGQAVAFSGRMAAIGLATDYPPPFQPPTETNIPE